MKKLIVLLVTLSIVFVCKPKPALAHLQAGPSYLLINGKYADTAPVVTSKILVAQDLVKDSVLVGNRVDMAINLSNITLPPTILASSKWRVAWDGRSPWENGETIKHVYPIPGSYFIKIQEKDQLTKDFQNYDLAQVNIVPKLQYKLPNASVSVSASRQDNGNLKVTFSAAPATDASTTIKELRWDFGDSQLASGTQVHHEYKPFVEAEYVTLRITDGNGIFNDTSWKLDQAGNLSKVNENYSSGTASVDSSKTDWSKTVLAVTAIALLFSGGVILAWKLKDGKNS
jgi:PKD domain